MRKCTCTSEEIEMQMSLETLVSLLSLIPMLKSVAVFPHWSLVTGYTFCLQQLLVVFACCL